MESRRPASCPGLRQGFLWSCLVAPLALSACDRPHVIDPDAAAYCERQGLPRATTANAECAERRVEELTENGQAPPERGDPLPIHPESLPSPGHPGGVTQIVEIVVKPGVKTTLHFAFSLKPDCTSAGVPTLRIARPPEHGTAQVTEREDYVRNATGGRATICDGATVPGMALDYTSAKTYVGPDWLEFDTVTPTGIATHFKVPIDVETPQDDED